MLKIIIIEDELKSRDALRNLIYRFCSDVQIVGEVSTVKKAVEMINSKKPDLVFLDIELPEQNGFALFDYYEDPPFEVIFTTAYDQFAIQAIRISAIDYLLKPINFIHLREAVQKVASKSSMEEKKSKIKVLSEIIQEEKFNKIALPVANGYKFININDIVFCKAERNYTLFTMIQETKHLVSKPLLYFEDVLCKLHFFRINRSIIININYVNGYSRANSGEVVLMNEERFSISDRMKTKFLKAINLPNR